MVVYAVHGRANGEHFSKQSKQDRQYARFYGWNYADKYDEVMATYHQQIYAIDVAVGMIRDALEEAGVAENTIIIYTSDNGFSAVPMDTVPRCSRTRSHPAFP